MKLPEPSGCVPGFIEPIRPGDLMPIPKLTIYPKRVTTPPLDFGLEDEIAASGRRLVDEIVLKVRAEDERMRRLLPAAPPGMRWESELQTREPAFDFDRDAAAVVVRLVYRLRELGG